MSNLRREQVVSFSDCQSSTSTLSQPCRRLHHIWHGGQNPSTVYVGQGNIADRLTQHRSDPRLLQYSSLGLFVTWAAAIPQLQAGIERYLADQLRPKVGEAYPNVPPVPVNLPW